MRVIQKHILEPPLPRGLAHLELSQLKAIEAAVDAGNLSFFDTLQTEPERDLFVLFWHGVRYTPFVLPD